MADGTIGLLGCAFILVLLANLKRLDMIKCKKNVKIFDGLFMHLDGIYIKRFIILFLKAAKRLSGVNVVYFMASTQVKQEYVNDALVPKYFNQHFPDRHVVISSSTHDGDFINIKSNEKVNSYPIGPSIDDHKTITFPHSKIQFAKHIEANKNRDIQDLWYLNFLRDAFKADVAVENNYIYMTHDQLAFLYYKLIGGTIGFLLAIDKIDNDIVYSVSF